MEGLGVMTSRGERLIAIRTLPNEMQAGIIRSVLTEAGIESWTRKADGFDYFGLGTIAAAMTSVTVRAEDAARAEAALEANRQDSVDIDWSEVDVGEPEDEAGRRIAAKGEFDGDARGGRRLPVKALFVWVVLIALAFGLTDTVIAPLVMTPVAVIDVVRRWRTR